jgi:hypothetical protein
MSNLLPAQFRQWFNDYPNRLSRRGIKYLSTAWGRQCRRLNGIAPNLLLLTVWLKTLIH